jgi:transposase
VLVAGLLAHIDALDQTVATLDARIAYYHITRDQVSFRELGPDWLARRHSVEHRTRRLVKQLEALGHTATLEAAT